MMEKRFTSTQIEKLGQSNENDQSINRENFDVGTKFMLDGKTWIVKKAFIDNGTQHRFVQSSVGDEQYLALHVLLKDREADGFLFLDLTDQERVMLKAQSLI